MTDLTSIKTDGAKSDRGHLLDILGLTTEWVMAEGWATPEARAALRKCRADVENVLHNAGISA